MSPIWRRWHAFCRDILTILTFLFHLTPQRPISLPGIQVAGSRAWETGMAAPDEALDGRESGRW